MRCLLLLIPVADPEGRGGLVKIIHKKDGHVDFMFIAPSPPGRWIRYWIQFLFNTLE